jgi:hypothetical protein
MAESTCYGRKPHAWGAVLLSATYGCHVQSCVICGRLRKRIRGAS